MMYQGLGIYKQRNGEKAYVTFDQRLIDSECAYPLSGFDSLADPECWAADGSYEASNVTCNNDLIEYLGPLPIEPGLEPLTADTKPGPGKWCDGKGGHWQQAYITKSTITICIGVRHAITQWRQAPVCEAGGYWVPFVPTPGPVMPEPIPTLEEVEAALENIASKCGGNQSWNVLNRHVEALKAKV